jgi:predicted GH43/DUF377 family glycosyl hydrolase
MTVALASAYSLERVGVLMEPDLDDPREVWGVLNPACARSRDGDLLLFPRLVAEDNVSRVGVARVLFADGVPSGVQRLGVALEPDESWEHSASHGGVEDPRITFVEDLDVYVMTYCAYGPLGPRIALAVSVDLDKWRRLGPVTFSYSPGLRADLNLYPNKDALLFPSAVPGSDGRACIAMLHRPMWDLSWVRDGERTVLPEGVHDERNGIWVSYVPLERAASDLSELTRVSGHRCVALPEHPWEAVKIGGGTPPVRTDAGWLTLHHGVAGKLVKGTDLQPHVHYSAGIMVHDPEDVGRLLYRSAEPLLEPEVVTEREGIVPNVVFPTALEMVSADTGWVFYGMADSRIGVARLTIRE